MKKAKKAIALLLAGCAVGGSGFTAAFATDAPSYTYPTTGSVLGAIRNYEKNKYKYDYIMNEWKKYWEKGGDQTQYALATPTITDAKYTHSTTIIKPDLVVRWDAVEGATSYEIKIEKADGTVLNYTSDHNSLRVTNIECPKVYVASTSTLTAATAQVRAISEDGTSRWSIPEKISCNSLH